MSVEKHYCNSIINYSTSRQILGKLINGSPEEKCLCIAKYYEGGYWYCGRHAPSKIAEREQKSFIKWEQRRSKND